MHVKQWKSICLLVLSLVTAAFMLSGCSGDDGRDGIDGLNAGQGLIDAGTVAPATLAALELTGEVTSVSISSPPVVRFRVKDANGNPIKGLGVASPTSATSLNYLRFTIAKLVPGTGSTPDKWVSYMVTTTSRPGTENVAANIVDNGDGSYVYTFAKNITDTAVTGGVTYEPTLTHRLAIQLSGNVPNASVPTTLEHPTNIIYDWVPAGGAVATKREITTTAACNECHEKIGVTTPHGGRVDTRYCVMCHNEQRKIGRTASTSTAGVFTGTTYVADGEVLGDFATMVHKIHVGSAIAGTSLTKTGYNYANDPAGQFDKMHGFPQEPKNCRKCHTATTAAPQGDNWKNKPTKEACVACHDSINITTGVGHSGGTTAWSTECATCHKADDIEGYHLTDNATPNNPRVPAGAVNFTYEISSVTVGTGADLNKPIVKFRILSDGGTGAAPTPVVFNAPGAASLLTGFTGSPSFLVAYAAAQDGIAASSMIDYNNLGKLAGQPASVSITNVWNGTQGTLTGPDSSGYYTATLTGTANAALFPAGSTRRAVALQAYFTQVSPAVARHTVSVVKTATGDSARRTVVSSAKCAKCHEWFEGHGGNRVYEVQVCVVCHVPNLSTSGRGADPATVLARLDIADAANGDPAGTSAAALTAAGYNPADPTTYPEESNNLKDMIHGIHAGEKRAAAGAPYRFVRDRGTSGVYYYDWSEVKFPGLLNYCEMCHNPGTYGETPANALATTNKTKDAGGIFTKTVPNATDLVTTPLPATCISCHGYGNDATAAHMTANGVGTANNILRSALPGVTQCVLCHTNHKIAAPAVVHGDDE